MRILLIDETAADIELALRLLRVEFPGAALVAVADPASLAEALAGPVVAAAVLAPVLSWAASEKVQQLLLDRWPRTAVVLFGHERDIVSGCLAPARGCAGIVRKSSGGFLALARIVGSALPVAPSPTLEQLPLPAVRIAPDGRITDATPDFAARLGVAVAALVGTALADHCRDAAGVRALFSGSAATATLTVIDVTGTDAGQLEVRRDEHGTLLGCLVSRSADGHARTVRRERDGDNGVNREMQDIALVFSHDLRQPMQQIARLARQLGEDASTRGDTRALDQLRTCAERAGSMLDGMLEYLALATREAPRGMIDLNDCLAEALANLRAVIDENGAQIYAERLPTIRGDAVQMMHLFQNILGNALKFRGRARPEIRVVCREAGQNCRIEVHDNGIGIPAPHRERVFEMGQRLHTREEYPGTGMGLALCRRITERHGGTVRIEGDADAGTVVVIELPRGDAQPTASV